MVNEGIIKEALNAVYEKTGIMFSRENIIIVMTDEFRKNPFYNGYYAYGTKIYIRPSLFEIDEEKFRQIFQNIKHQFNEKLPNFPNTQIDNFKKDFWYNDGIPKVWNKKSIGQNIKSKV